MSFNLGKAFVSRSIIDQDNEEHTISNIEPQGNQQAQEYDPRTLYERLQEQRTIKEEQFQELTKLSNLVKRVDDDEAEYLQTLTEAQRKIELERKAKEREELDAYRREVENARASVSAAPPVLSTKPITTPTPKPSATSKTNQKAKGKLGDLVVVKRKREDDTTQDSGNKSDAQTTPVKKPKAEPASKEPVPAISALVAAYSDDSSSDDES